MKISFEKIALKIGFALLWSFAIYMIYLIMNTAAFSIDDDWTYLDSIIKGMPFIEWIGYGRFSPLASIDSNILLLLPFWHTAISIWFLSAIKFAILIYILYKLLPNVTVNQKIITITTIISLPFLFPLLNVFTNVSLIEKLLLPTLALFMLCYTKAKNTDNSKWWILAFIMAAINTYSKEPMFGVFIIIAAIDFLFGKRTKSSNMFNIGIIINAVIFLILWYIFSVIGYDSLYDGGFAGATLTDTIKNVFAGLHILYAVLILFVYRLYKFFIKKDRKHIIEDSFLFAGIAYAVSNIVLNMQFDYYYYVTIILSLPILLRLFVEHKQNKKINFVLLFILIFSFGNYPREVVKNDMAKEQRSYQFTSTILYLSNFYNAPINWYSIDDDGKGDLYKKMYHVYQDYLSNDKKQIQDFYNGNKKDMNAIYIASISAENKTSLSYTDDLFKSFFKCGELYFWDRHLVCYIKKRK